MKKPNANDAFAQLVQLLERSIGKSHELLHDFSVVRRTRRYKIFALILMNEICRKSEGVHAMARSATYSGINLVVRGALENYVDLVNVFRDREGYPDYMVWSSYNQERSWLRALANHSHTHFARQFGSDAERYGLKSPNEMLAAAQETLRILEDKLQASYKDRNGKVVRSEVLRFRLADKGLEYDILYRHLSRSAHGRVDSMLEGIATGHDVRWPPSDQVRRPTVALDALCAILLDSAIRIAKQFNRPVTLFRNLQKDHTKIRGVDAGILPYC